MEGAQRRKAARERVKARGGRADTEEGGQEGRTAMTQCSRVSLACCSWGTLAGSAAASRVKRKSPAAGEGGVSTHQEERVAQVCPYAGVDCGLRGFIGRLR